jgi:HlyD family secretion protein
MKFFLKLLVVLGILVGMGWGAASVALPWWAARNKPKFRTVKAETGDIRISVNASGSVKPVISVQIGSFVSGPIMDLFVDFNEEVKAGQVLATIDPRLYDANVRRDEAALMTRQAEVERVKAELGRARNDEARSVALKEENVDYISKTELDQFRFSRMALEAQLLIAEATVKQAEANLENSQANLNYTKITSPVDGMVIDRLIEPGQTLAAQFQTPEMFVVAPKMKERMHIFASVDEADIGLIKEAKETKQPVFFTVDAYPDKIFDKGEIEEVRLSATTNQNVVTYPVVVGTPNAEMLLLPGMTANLTFQIRELKEVLKIPNAALRYYPEKRFVRPADHARLDLSIVQEPEEDEGASTSSVEQPVDDAAKAGQAASKRIVWVKEGDLLKAIDIQIGDSDYQFTQVVSGDLKAGDELVVGLEKAK